MLRRVPGGVSGFKLYLTDREAISVLEQLYVVVSLPAPLVFPLLIPLVREIDPSPHLFGQFPASGEKIRMDMRLRRSYDSQVGLGGNPDIPIDVPFRIDDDRFTRLLTADQIRILSQVRIFNLPEIHEVNPPCEVSARAGTQRANYIRKAVFESERVGSLVTGCRLPVEDVGLSPRNQVSEAVPHPKSMGGGQDRERVAAIRERVRRLAP